MKKLVTFCTAVFVLCIPELIKADTIYESATLSGVGINSGGPGIMFMQALGGRFYIAQPVQVTAIGGHISSSQYTPGTIFGAIVSLSGADALPSGNTSTPIANMSEVLAKAVFTPNYPSTDYRESLSVVLQPGYYALIFGTNALGASNGQALMPINGQTALPGGTSLILWTDASPGLWHAVSDFSCPPWDGWPRFVVEGTVIPEPATAILMIVGAGIFRLRHRKR